MLFFKRKKKKKDSNFENYNDLRFHKIMQLMALGLIFYMIYQAVFLSSDEIDEKIARNIGAVTASPIKYSEEQANAIAREALEATMSQKPFSDIIRITEQFQKSENAGNASHSSLYGGEVFYIPSSMAGDDFKINIESPKGVFTIEFAVKNSNSNPEEN